MKPPVVVMGVSASGKSLIGKLLADCLKVPFCDSDELHPTANINKMRAGIALDDNDRAPWLDAIADWIKTHVASGGIVACSALKLAYRDRLRGVAHLRFVYLAVDATTLRERLAERQCHFMPASLLQSQLNSLEPPGPASMTR